VRSRVLRIVKRAALLRMSSDPFLPYMLGRIEEDIGGIASRPRTAAMPASL